MGVCGGDKMTTLEKIENIDKLMKQYKVNDIYSLIEELLKNQRTEQDDIIQSEWDYLKGLYDDFKISQFISNVDFDTVQTKVVDDKQVNKPKVIISFYLDVLD